MPPQRIINVHAHLHPHQDIDARVRLWRECGVEKACVMVLGSKARNQTYDNQAFLQLMKRHPDIIVGFAKVNLGAAKGNDAPEDVERYNEQGFTGLKLIGPSYPYDDERYFPIYDRAQALGMPVFFHTGWLAFRREQKGAGVSQDKMRPMLLDTLAREFPDLRMMMGHVGTPEFEVGLYLITHFENLYGEMSGGGGSRTRRSLLWRALRPYSGANLQDPEENLALGWFRKLCFGTDNPDPPVYIELYEWLMGRLEIPEATRELFWWKNAAAWLGLQDT